MKNSCRVPGILDVGRGEGHGLPKTGWFRVVILGQGRGQPLTAPNSRAEGAFLRHSNAH